MDRNSSRDIHRDLVGEFRRRFPLCDRIVGQFGAESPVEPIPWFFGFILTAAARPEPGACCFVLDKTPGTTALAAILAALTRFQHDFGSWAESYARTALLRGQRVKVRPSNFVFEYDGLWETFPGLFKLRLLGEDAWLSFPLADVLRLEPTDHVRPKGTAKSKLGEFERGPLDHLLDLTTCGNNSVIRNVVLVHMARTHFARIADSITIAQKHDGQLVHLTGLPWGSVDRDGGLKPSDPYQVVGEPLIATTNVPEDLALACSSADLASKFVLVDGARSLARDLQAFDDIADRQRTVILASRDEREEVDLLKERGCAIWHMSADEVLIGESSVGQRVRQSFVGATVRAADVRRRSNVRAVECHDEVLEAAAASLERAVEMIGGGTETIEVEEVLARLFRILFEFSECCFGVGEGVVPDLDAAKEHMARHAMWLDPAVARELRAAIGALERAVVTGAGQQKAEAFLSILTEQDGQWAVAVRSPRTAETLREVVDNLGSDIPVFTVSAMGPDHEYGGIIVPAWPMINDSSA